MALFFTHSQRAKLSLVIVVFAVLTSTNLAAQNHRSNKTETTTIVIQQMEWIVGKISSEYKKASVQLIKTPNLKLPKGNLPVVPKPKNSECICKPKKQGKYIEIRTHNIKPNETHGVKLLEYPISREN